ncbi:MAG: S8 family serine peptidase, partial [Acidobacteriota bacterium]
MKLVCAARGLTTAAFAAALIGGAPLTVPLAAQSIPKPILSRKAADPRPPLAGGIAPQGLARIDALLREKATRSPVERKIDSQLLYARRMQQGLPVAPGVQSLRVNLPYAADGHVVVDVKAEVTSRLLARLGRLTREVVKSSPRDLQLHVTLAQVAAIAADPEVVFVQPRQRAFTSGAGPRKTVTRRTGGAARRAAAGDAVRHALAERAASRIGTGQGSVTSQADIVHRTALFRALTGANGSGVKIGVLSDGVTNLARAQSTGDLGPVTILSGQEGDGDEGTAMLELLHDIAPGAQLYFATAFTSIPSFAQNIADLRAAGCDIIVDDVFYFVETPFQDGQGPAVESITNGGLVTQAVKAVTADGALYFSSAGNAGNLNDGTSGVWEGDFLDGGATADPLPSGILHDFAPGVSYNTLTLDGQGLISLFWADPLGGSANDYDLFGLNADGTDVIASSTNIQDGTQDPYEATISDILNPRIVIVKGISAEARFLHLNTNWGQLETATAGQTHGHAATSAPFSFGVAASTAADAYPGAFRASDVVESFSSDGPRRILFTADGTAITPGNLSSTGGELLSKPDFTAADGVSVTGAGYFDGQFYGTSAAAPNAAAIAALFKSANPSWTQAEVKDALLSSAIDIEAPGVDQDSGAGILMAVAPEPSCSFSTTGATATVGAAGGPGSASVMSLSGCSCTWIAWSTVSWIAVGGSGAATGTSALGYTVAPNLGPARVGIIQIEGGQTVTVSQLGAPAAAFSNTTPLEIPDEDTAESSIVVSGLTRPIGNVTLSLHVTHTFDADLTFSLVGPDGTSIDLSANNGSSGQDYGTGCTAPGVSTTFDDSAAVLISSGAAPFAGRFRPEQPLSTFNGKSGAAANGAWTLRINDAFAQDVGTLVCWSLQINQVAPLPSFPDATNLGVFRPSIGRWFLTGQPAIDFGVSGDLPVPGDYNGDGIRDVALFRPSNGTWYIAGGPTIVWGAPGDIPVPADYDGDQVTDIAVFRPSTGVFYVRNGATVAWGAAGDLPVVGDYDGDGKADMAVYRPSN